MTHSGRSKIFDMFFPKQVIFLSAMAGLSGCQQWAWPPYESAARDLFIEYRDQFTAIDAEMANDQLLYLTSAQISGTERERAFRVQPKLNDEQRAKYRQIIGENTVFSFSRKDGVLSVSRYMPPAQERDFQFWYVHDVRPPDAPHCDSDVKKVACGDCIVQLDDEWFMAWMWHPYDETEYDESCSYLLEREMEYE